MDLITFLVGHSYVGMIAAALIANLFPGIPEEIFLLSLGYLSSIQGTNIWIMTVFLSIGLLISDITLFLLIKKGNKIAKKIIDKLLGDWFNRDKNFLAKRASYIVVISRFVPFLRFTGPFTAATVGWSVKKFLIHDIPALLVYLVVILHLGVFTQGRIEKIQEGFSVAGNIVLLMILVTVIIMFVRNITAYFRKAYDTVEDPNAFGFTRLEKNEETE